MDRSLQMIRLDGASAPSLLELSKRYSELNPQVALRPTAHPTLTDRVLLLQNAAPQMTQLGLDDSSYYWGNKLSVARHEEGEAIAAYGNALHARRCLMAVAQPRYPTRLPLILTRRRNGLTLLTRAPTRSGQVHASGSTASTALPDLASRIRPSRRALGRGGGSAGAAAAGVP